MKGTYLAQVEDHFLTETGDKKTPEIKVKFHCIKDVPKNTDVDFTCFADLWLTDGAFQNTMKALTTLGWRGDNLEEIDTDPPILAQHECWVVLDEEEYNGKQYTKVKFVNPVGGYQQAKRMEEPEKLALAAKLKGKILAFRQANPVSSDGLPF